MIRTFFLLAVFSATVSVSEALEPQTLQESIRAVQKIGPLGEGHREAIPAMQVITKSPASLLPEILSGMSDNVLSNNWLRSAVESVIDRTRERGGQLPREQLIAFVKDATKPSRGRELAYQIVSSIDAPAADELLAGMADDSSVELRRIAVGKLLQAAQQEQNQLSRIAAFKKAFEHARDKDQIETAAESLRELKQEVDLARHFGFVMKWHLIAPFDNTDTNGFDRPYPPESAVDLEATLPGKGGAQLKWVRHVTEDEYGLVDLNKALGKHKGACAYAFVEFNSPKSSDAEFRLGCINANKIWVNGQLLTENHVYHAGRGVDQYVAKGKLRKGKNAILLKICQNEQTENWAQDWQFQFRICDSVGTAILSAERLAQRLN